jgi:hypothetical protein
MFDNSNPFDLVIAEIDEAIEALRPPAPPRMTPAQASHLQRIEAEKIREMNAAKFRNAYAAFVVQRGRLKRWTREDFIAAKALSDYLTSSKTAVLTVQPRQCVADTVKTLFKTMVEKGTGLPDGYFQGERDNAAKEARKVVHLKDRRREATSAAPKQRRRYTKKVASSAS